MTELETKIKQYAQAYYDGNPIVSDDVFDNLVNELRMFEPDSELLKTGWGYSVEETESTHLQKFLHAIHIGSLDKIKIEQLLNTEEFYPIIKSEQAYITPKLDGGSAVCYYENGKLLRVVTRGDGTSGLDITQNIKHKIPKEVPNLGKFQVRGEIILTWEDYRELDGKHPRNKAIGITQSKEVSKEELDRIRFVAFRSYVTENDETNPTYSDLEDTILFLHECGFETPKYFPLTDLNELKSSYEMISVFLKKSLDDKTFPIDGLVITDQYDAEKSFALKLEDEQIQTTVVGIEWNLTQTGRYVPVVLVEPFIVDGVTISRISGNNATWLKEMGLGVGAKIMASRANGVIPHINETIERVEIDLSSMVCPDCGEPLEFHNRDLICVNEMCPGKEIANVRELFQFLLVDGVGPTVVETIIEEFDLTRIEKFMKFLEDVISGLISKEEIQSVVGNSYGAKVHIGVQEQWKWHVNLKQFLLMANIPGLGDSISTRLAKELSIQEFREFVSSNSHVEKIKSIVNNSATEKSLFSDYTKTKLHRLSKFIFLTEYVQEFTGLSKMTYAVTGGLSKPRKDIVKEFLQFGYEWVDPGKADVLIADAPSSSSKYKTAQKRDIPIMTEAEFRRQYLCVFSPEGNGNEI